MQLEQWTWLWFGWWQLPFLTVDTELLLTDKTERNTWLFVPFYWSWSCDISAASRWTGRGWGLPLFLSVMRSVMVINCSIKSELIMLGKISVMMEQRIRFRMGVLHFLTVSDWSRQKTSRITSVAHNDQINLNIKNLSLCCVKLKTGSNRTHKILYSVFQYTLHIFTSAALKKKSP